MLSTQWIRRIIFGIELVYLAILADIAWAFLTGHPYDWMTSLPKTIVNVPIGVLWFGALGGILISLAGVHEHRYNWDREYWSWHLVRPLVGASVALIAVMIIQAGILATGQPGAVSPSDKTIGTDNTFYYLVAFIAGYREATFRGMVKRLSDVILTSEGAGGSPSVRIVDPNHGPAAGGNTVKVKGAALGTAESVTFGLEAGSEFKVGSDNMLEVKAPAGTSGETVDVIVASAAGSTTLAAAYTYDA